MSIESVILSNHLILCCPLLLPPSVFPSIRVFSSESVLLIRWPKCWSFSFSIIPSNEYSVLISLRIDWFDLLAIKGTLKNFLQHCGSKSINSLVLSFLYGSPPLKSPTKSHGWNHTASNPFRLPYFTQLYALKFLSFFSWLGSLYLFSAE